MASVFHANGEPFVDVAGAPAEAIVAIVRACPSGALGYARNGMPYAGEDRAPETLEHFALCRCGHSKDKPFCDGSHWYAKFQDDDNPEGGSGSGA